MTRAWATTVTRPLRDTTMRAALRGSTWALAGTLAGRMANVGALLLAARQLGSEQFGALSLALSTTLVVTAVSALGLPVAAQKLVAEAREIDFARRDRLIDIAVALTATIGTAAMVGVASGSAWISAGVLKQQDVASLVAVASILILATPMVELSAALLAALEDFVALGCFRAAHGCLCGVVLVVTLAGWSSAMAAVVALAAAEVAACVVGLMLTRSARGPRTTESGCSRSLVDEARALTRIALPALLTSVSLQPALWLGQVLLSRRPDGLEHVGTFAVAMRWYSIACFVPATMGLVLLPMLGRLRATGREGDARDLFVRYGVLTLAISAATGGTVIAFAGPLMGLQGAEYATGAGVLVVLAIATVPTGMNNVLSNRALAESRLALWVWSDLALSATLVVGALLLIPPLGGIGLATAHLLAYAATCAVLLPLARAAVRGRRGTST